MANPALKKLKMPEKRPQDPMLEMDELDMEEAPMEPSEEEEEFEPGQEPKKISGMAMLAKVSDEELFEEFKKRGLKPEDMESEEPMEEEMPLEEIPEEESEEY